MYPSHSYITGENSLSKHRLTTQPDTEQFSNCHLTCIITEGCSEKSPCWPKEKGAWLGHRSHTVFVSAEQSHIGGSTAEDSCSCGFLRVKPCFVDEHFWHQNGHSKAQLHACQAQSKPGLTYPPAILFCYNMIREKVNLPPTPLPRRKLHFP